MTLMYEFRNLNLGYIRTFPLENITIFVLPVLTFNFHILQYDFIASNDFRSSVGDSARITVSSA